MMLGKIKILFITNFHLGDAVLDTALLKYFTDKYTKSEITVISGKSSQLIFQNFQCVKKTYPIVKDSLHLHWFKLWLKVFYKKWDIVVDCRGLYISHFLYAKQKYYKIVRHVKNDEPLADRMKHCLGVTSIPFPHVRIGIGHERRANTIISAKLKNPLITIAPISKNAYKTWPIEYFIKLVDLIRSRTKFQNAKFLVTAAPQEHTLCLPLLKHLKDDAISIIKEDILTTAACIKKSNLFIGNDSGLIHLASAVNTPVIGLYLPLNSKVYAPFGENKNLVICSNDIFPYTNSKKRVFKNNLMHSLRPEKVFEEFCKFVELI